MSAIFEWKSLDSNGQNQVADQGFSLKQWFAGGAQSRSLRKPGCAHCYLRVFVMNKVYKMPSFPPIPKKKKKLASDWLIL